VRGENKNLKNGGGRGRVR
jgi:hypothetical protein